MLRPLSWPLACAVALFLASGPVAAQVEEGKARKLPWSGYWWPQKQGLLVAENGPLSKYDRFVGQGKALASERTKHPPGAGEDWWGYCHAWSAAAVLDAEPVRPMEVTGSDGKLPLTVGDMKGLLTASHYSDTANVYGNRYNGADDDLSDPPPCVLWKYLKMYVKQQGLPLIIDIDAGTPVWNYPCYMYRVTYKNTGGENFACSLELWFADDAVAPNFVGIKPMARRYSFTCRMRNGAVVLGSGKWIGASVQDHPDFAWYPTGVRSENPELKYETVVKMIGPTTGELNGPPLTDPNNPPQPDTHVPDPPPVPLPNPNGAPVPPQPASLLSPNDLMAMVLHRKNKASDFGLTTFVDTFNPILTVGDRFAVGATSQKPGYLYLMHVDPDGDYTLIFPMPGQANAIRRARRSSAR